MVLERVSAAVAGALLALLAISAVALAQIYASDCEAATSSGRIRGSTLTSRLDTLIYAFTRVPYAKPPLGNLRFADPVKADPWSGVLNATGVAPQCVQFNYIIPSLNVTTGDEDCLYLNVYTPSLDPSSNLPVICYFYGGAWYTGSIADHNPQYLLTRDVVLVEVSYRLGALGFLSLEDDKLSGNYGLKDQSMGLRWIKENIRNFGGDPNQVTLLGESVGGSSTHLHMFTPWSRGLFHRSISISGTAVSPFAVLPAGLSRARALNLAATLGCTARTTDRLIACLRARPAYDVINAQRTLFVWELDPLVVLGPVVDKASKNPFLPVHPGNTRSPPIPWVTGISSGEGLLRSARFTLNPVDYKTFSMDFNRLAPIMLLYNWTVNNTDAMSQRIRNYYFGNTEITERSFKNLTDMVTDAFFLYPAIEALKRHTGPGYLYYFDYLGRWSFIDHLAPRRILNLPTHTDETIYLFNYTSYPLAGRDESISATLVNYFTNFVIYGEPTPKSPKKKFVWPQWRKQKSYLHLTKDGSFIEKNLLTQRYRFWSSLFSA